VNSTAFFGPRTKRGFIIATAAVPLLTMMGALGTDQLPFWPRLFYWFILMEAGALIGMGASLAVEHWGGLRHRLWLHMALIAFLIALPLTLVLVGTTSIFFKTPPPNLATLGSFLGIVFIVSYVMTILNYFLRPAGDDGGISPLQAASTAAAPPPFPPSTTAAPIDSDAMDAAPLTTSATPAPVHAFETPETRVTSMPRFADRLPLPQRNQTILALEAEDHYLRVHLESGSALILMRLSDAIIELSQDAAAPTGAQTHRSWWVAQAAVSAIAKADGRAVLTLANGAAAPVSRTHYKALSVAGWFRG
jgi:LytTr DNA-binding domain